MHCWVQPGLREADVPVAVRADSGSRQPSQLIALARTLLAKGASKVWILGGGAAAVTRRCEMLQASVRFCHCSVP